MAAVGRDRELRDISTFLTAPGTADRVLLLEGEAGIGKTTLWDEALSLGRPSYRVLSARPLEIETRISFATIGDLLAGSVDEISAELPLPQRRAIETALLLAEPTGDPPDP